MKPVVNSEVIQSWTESREAKNHKGTLTTTGLTLWSYDLQIGDTIDGVKVVRDYSARGKWGYKSQTTSCHVGLARQWADLID